MSDDFLRCHECAVCGEDQYWHWLWECEFCGDRVCNGEGGNYDCSSVLKKNEIVYCDNCWERAHGLE